LALLSMLSGIRLEGRYGNIGRSPLGGFPLTVVRERISPVWASEIEDVPVSTYCGINS
jgi:hypothetical protein